MKLNKRIIKYGVIVIFLLIIAIVVFVILGIRKNRNILYNMKDGLENADLLQYYEEDIKEVQMMSNAPITIRYFDIDLNDDGLKDKIVYITSSFHSGSHGDYFSILLNKGNDYEEILIMTLSLYHQYEDKVLGEVYIMKDMTNGFYDLKVKTDKNQFILKYKNGWYEYNGI